MTAQRVAGIGRIGDDTAGIDNLYGLMDQSRLRVSRMDLKKLTHEYFEVTVKAPVSDWPEKPSLRKALIYRKRLLYYTTYH
jgi:hypothetical protein